MASLEEVHRENDADSDIVDTSTDGCLKIFPRKLCHPRYALHRYFVLIFMCALGFGSYYCYDNPASLQNQIISDMGINVGSFSQLYAWYSWPNTILCFFGGFLIDRVLGIRWGAIVFSGFIFFGQIVFAAGAFFNSFILMIVGRFIFGIGGESLAVAQNTYAVSWFKDKELNMVFGVQLSIARLGSTVNLVTMVNVYNMFSHWFHGHSQLGMALFAASVTCLFSFSCAVILAFFDKRAEKLLNKDTAMTGEKINLTDVKDFNFAFWMISMICVTYYVTIFPFTSLGSTFFQRKYDMNQSEANFVDSIIYLISAFISPVLGIIVDYTGRNLTWVFVSIVVTAMSQCVLAFTFIPPTVAMVMMGVGYSILACALWPMVSLVVDENKLGTAYGIMQSVQNLGLGTVIIIAGYIVDSAGYLVLEIFFLAWISLCLIFLALLYISDQRNGGFLNMSVKQRRNWKKDDPEPNFEIQGPST